ncbi:hypothetical protein Q3G72_001322 [Acer saccharum]|nr:hypothetical protein Q3G72_001322 [Acer saccharum]
MCSLLGVESSPRGDPRSSSLPSPPQPPVRHGCEATSTVHSFNRSVKKGKGVVVEPSHLVVKRKRSSEVAPWEHASATILEKAFRVAPSGAVPVPQAPILAPGAFNPAPHSTKKTLLAMTNGLTFFWAHYRF